MRAAAFKLTKTGEIMRQASQTTNAYYDEIKIIKQQW
jgi:hypothetical protein